MRCAASTACGARFERASGSLLRPLFDVCPSRVSVFAIVLVTAFAVGCRDGRSASDDADEFGDDGSVAVEAVTVEPQPFSVEVALTGQLEAEHEVVMRSELDGVIRTIEFQEGQPVAQGDVLFTMRDEEQRARLSEARAQERLARDVYDRTRTLTSQDISSVARRAEAAAALDEAKAKIALAELNLDRTRIMAPFDGVVGSRLVGPGEWVEPQTPLVPVAAIEKLQLHYLLPEPSIRLAKVGGQVHVRVVAYPDERFPGETFFVSPTVDRATRRLLAKAWVPNDDHRLKPGMFANVDVLVLEKEGVLVVPDSAMIYDRHGTYVWRIDDEGRAEKVPVEIGIRRFSRVEILDGIQAGDRVITAGINKVMAGSALDVRPAVAGTGREDDDVHARGRDADTEKPEPGVEG
jgi:membrane fusion protein (multidrug efflux system)